MILPVFPLLMGFVVGQRLTELWLARRNTRRLLEEGGVEVAPRHYPLFILLHAAWLGSLVLTVDLEATASMPLVGLYLVIQAARVWTIASLGRYWTTRIITVPGHPLVRHGPYRFVRHPNYLIVAAEVAVLPLIFGAVKIALIFSILSGLLTIYRIRREEAALAGRPQ